MASLADKYADQGVIWIAVNSGAEGKQGAGLERNLSARDEYSIEYPILLDMSGDVGRNYGAVTTPHMYIIDTEGVLRYAGGIDDNSSARQLGETNYVDAALTALFAGEAIETTESRPYGCSVKY